MIPDPEARQWLTAAACGDRDSAAALLHHFHPLVYAYLRRLTVHDADAADLTQVTFVRAWQSLARFRGASTVATWLHRIAYCSYVDWRRRQRETTATSDTVWQNIPASGPLPSETAGERDLALQLQAAVARLPDEERHAVHLHYYQGLTLAETGEVLGLPPSTLKYRLRTALTHLRRSLPADAILPNP